MFVIAAAAAIAATAPWRGWSGGAWRRRRRASHLRCGSGHLRRRAGHLRGAWLECGPAHLRCRAHPAIATAAETQWLRARRSDLRLRARGLEARTIIAAVEARLKVRCCGARFWTRRGHLRAPATAAELRLWGRRRDTRLRLEARAIAPHPMIAAHGRRLGAVGIALGTSNARRIGLSLWP